MAEYIKREEAIEDVDNLADYMSVSTSIDMCLGMKSMKSRALSALNAIPAADVVLVVHAHWIPQKENHEFKEAWMKCSACGYPVSKWTGNTNFCPHCGAKMDGGADK